LKTLYPVSSTFKTRQKSNSRRLIPFEAIDNKIYKTNSNCTCFLTSESRIHAWIKALAEVLYIGLGSKSDSKVVWRDHNDKSNIVHTEFIVNDKCKETDTNNEDMFKETDTSNEDMFKETDTSNEDMLKETDTSNEGMFKETDTSNEDMFKETDTSNEDVFKETDTSNEVMFKETDTSNADMFKETDTSNEVMFKETDTSNEVMFKETDTSNEDMFKVIVYNTAGKVMIQGNFWNKVFLEMSQFRDRPLNLQGGYGFLFRSEIFFRTTREFEY
jgi:hypothetical protein